jgi:hypothetical protein
LADQTPEWARNARIHTQGPEIDEQLRRVFESSWPVANELLGVHALPGSGKIAAQFRLSDGKRVEVTWIIGTVQEVIG